MKIQRAFVYYIGGLAIDSTIQKCRDMIWNDYVKPRYYDQVRQQGLIVKILYNFVNF